MIFVILGVAIALACYRFMEEMNQIVECKYCGKPVMYGELTWLEGKCMCPRCYQAERAKKDKEAEEFENER